MSIFSPAPYCKVNPHDVLIDFDAHVINDQSQICIGRTEAGFHSSYNIWLSQSGTGSSPSAKHYHPTQYEAEAAALHRIEAYCKRTQDNATEIKEAKAILNKITALRSDHINRLRAENAALKATPLKT